MNYKVVDKILCNKEKKEKYNVGFQSLLCKPCVSLVLFDCLSLGGFITVCKIVTGYLYCHHTHLKHLYCGELPYSTLVFIVSIEEISILVFKTSEFVR